MNTRKFRLFLIAAAIMCPGIAGAQDREGQDREGQDRDGWYLSGSGTISLLQDTKGTIANAPVPGSTVRTENSFETGYGAQLAVGRMFGRFRIEGEVGYTHNEQDDYVAIVPPTGRMPADVRQRAFRGMLNAYFDFAEGPVQPYVGAGAGAAHIDVLFIGPRAPFPTEAPRKLIDDSDTRFAYQLIGGVAVPFSRSAAFTLQYRWFDAGTFEGKDSRGERFTRDHAGHNIDLGVRLRF